MKSIPSHCYCLLVGLFILGVSTLDASVTPKVIAHRGYWKTPSSAQNSLRSLIKADSIGSFGSEFDVWLTKDKVLVVNHDDDINGIPIETSLSQIVLKEKLENGEAVPTLDAYLETAKDLNTMLICELKPHKDKKHEAEAVKRIIKAVKKKGLENRMVYITFSPEGLVELIKHAPKGTTVYYLNGEKTPQELKDLNAAGLDYNLSVLKKNPQWIEQAHQLGLSVNAWTVNKVQDMQWCIDHKVDFITTNEPVQLQHLINN